MALYFSQPEGTFTYVLLAHSVGILAYSLVNAMGGANSFEEKENALTTPASPKQRIQQLNIKALKDKLDLRNKKMETLVNELKNIRKHFTLWNKTRHLCLSSTRQT